MDLQTPLAGLPGIGPSLNWHLQKLGLTTVEDLITHYPFRYDDFSNVSNVLEAKIGEKVTLTGEIWTIKNVYTRSKKIITQAIFNDGTGPIEITWFNQPYLTKTIKTGDRLQISGKITKFRNKLSITAPVWEKLTSEKLLNETVHTGRLVPVYPETEGLTSKWIRAKISLLLPEVLPLIKDPLPEEVRNSMLGLTEAIKLIHFPNALTDAFQAKKRLQFDELFFIQLATQKTRMEWRNKALIEPVKVDKKKAGDFTRSLPFSLTNAQKRVAEEVLQDLSSNQPMNRLVQGEVGSGKTVIASIASYAIHSAGLKALFMAPTEILAFQHYSTLKRLLEPAGVTVGVYTGSKKFTSDKRSTTHDPHVVVGTHALISKKLNLEDIGLIIVDEQQRFGVEQRTILRGKAKVPHFLTMTATPIPRTVALTLYGDLDLSIIDELPKGRQHIDTFVVPAKKRNDAYGFIEKKITEGGDQAYIITPLIEQSETLQSAKAAVVEFEKLKSKIFPKLKLGLLHGRLKPIEKDAVLNDFKDKKIDILVSTSVVEVGVDVPNATIMLIESAERFGLAQLHQLRGRVGRGEKKSYCLLFSENEDNISLSRLKNLEKIDDGLKLAEMDLKIRGAGQIFGVSQSGRWDLKIASLDDFELIKETKDAARRLLDKNPKLDKYPILRGKLQSLAKEVMPD